MVSVIGIGGAQRIYGFRKSGVSMLVAIMAMVAGDDGNDGVKERKCMIR
jgi:hypothetical protein